MVIEYVLSTWKGKSMSKASVTFTKESLDQLKPEAKDYYIKDPKTPYLMLRVYKTGYKSYILNRRVGDEMQKIKIGRYDCITISQARNKATQINADITKGANPRNEKREAKKALSFKQLYEIYYEQHALPFTKRAEANRKTVELHVLPVFGKLVASKITQQEIRSYHASYGEKISKYSKSDNVKKSHSTANRVIAIVSAVFNFGIENNIISCTNPCVGLKKRQSVSRDRFLNYDELKAFFEALKEEEKIFSDFFKIALYTGARKTNVLSMKRTDINYNIKQWRLSEAETKNKDVNIISLSEPALKLLMTRDMFNEFSKLPSVYIFPGPGKHGYLNDPKKSFNRIKKYMNVFDIRIHDLRRTLGSYMAISGSSLPIIGKALNHKSHISTTIYARLSHDPILNAVNTATDLMQQPDEWRYYLQ